MLPRSADLPDNLFRAIFLSLCAFCHFREKYAKRLSRKICFANLVCACADRVRKNRLNIGYRPSLLLFLTLYNNSCQKSSPYIIRPLAKLFRSIFLALLLLDRISEKSPEIRLPAKIRFANYVWKNWLNIISQEVYWLPDRSVNISPQR